MRVKRKRHKGQTHAYTNWEIKWIKKKKRNETERSETLLFVYNRFERYTIQWVNECEAKRIWTGKTNDPILIKRMSGKGEIESKK